MQAIVNQPGPAAWSTSIWVRLGGGRLSCDLVLHKERIDIALLHEWAIWRPKPEGIRGLRPPDLGPLPCRSKPMLLAVNISPSSGTE